MAFKMWESRSSIKSRAVTPQLLDCLCINCARCLCVLWNPKVECIYLDYKLDQQQEGKMKLKRRRSRRTKGKKRKNNLNKSMQTHLRVSPASILSRNSMCSFSCGSSSTETLNLCTELVAIVEVIVFACFRGRILGEYSMFLEETAF